MHEFDALGQAQDFPKRVRLGECHTPALRVERLRSRAGEFVSELKEPGVDPHNCRFNLTKALWY